MYTGNLDRLIKTDDACDYLKENSVKVLFMCASLSEGHWDERPASFHVEVNYASKDIIMQGSFWKVRNWSFPKKGKSSVR